MTQGTKNDGRNFQNVGNGYRGTWRSFVIIRHVLSRSDQRTRYGGVDPKLLMIAIAVAATGLFAKPVWLLGNWREIRTWERTTAFVRKSYTTGRGRRTRYHICLEFYSKDGKARHKEIEGRTMFKTGDRNDIMFADEYMDALLFVPQAFKQAVGSAIAGVLLETVCVICLLVL